MNLVFESDNDSDEHLSYYSKLSTADKTAAFNHLKEINNYQSTDKPVLFQIMSLPLPLSQKNHILKTYVSVKSSESDPDVKLKAWFDSLMTIPFGKYKGINLKSITTKQVKSFINDLQTVMDNAVYGHDEAKRQITQMMGQLIRNPNSKGNVLGIWGPMGNGKTTLIKEGIAKAMDKPFVFISLGGASDSSFLEGHSYTYEGSIYGRILNGLITSQCMNPIIYFDELDKISKTHQGDEITNILIHLTDPAQNSHFRDKYFHGVDIDLSKATMIFSFNDPSNVNPILLDRITTVETKYLMVSQKIHIASQYLLPEIIKDIGLNQMDITIDETTIRDIIDKYTYEGGVRKLKTILYNMCRELNLANLVKSTINTDKVNFPFVIKSRHLKFLLQHKMEIEHDKIHPDDRSGVVNGLWANTAGIGGVLSIETMLIPSTTFLSVKATGHLEKVIKESTEVATSLAWNYLPESVKNKYLKEMKDKPIGIHIHCPDGSTPKDGPSAGAALTLALYSLLTGIKIKHDIAMTGEINLEGKVTAIGGLEEKLEGAKRAGVKLVLFPRDNLKHLNKIKERNAQLLNDNFKVLPIDTFDDVMKYALIQ
jgi:endopeptidase La